MKKIAFISLTIFLFFGILSAEDISQDVLSKWLCQVLASPNPENELVSFPAQNVGKVEYNERAGIGTRTQTKWYEWILSAGKYKVRYTFCLDSKKNMKSSFYVRIKSSADDSLIFKSIADAQEWLASLGQVVRDPDDDDVIAAVDNIEEDPRFRTGGLDDYRWCVTIDVEFREVVVHWYKAQDNLGRRFCR